MYVTELLVQCVHGSTSPIIFEQFRKQSTKGTCLCVWTLSIVMNAIDHLIVLGVHNFATFLIATQPLGLWSEVLAPSDDIARVQAL